MYGILRALVCLNVNSRNTAATGVVLHPRTARQNALETCHWQWKRGSGQWEEGSHPESQWPPALFFVFCFLKGSGGSEYVTLETNHKKLNPRNTEAWRNDALKEFLCIVL